jgi:hypothetical protein
MQQPTASSLSLETIPAPELVRERLTNALRDVTLLRSMLRLSERAAKERQRRVRPPVGGAGSGIAQTA